MTRQNEIMLAGKIEIFFLASNVILNIFAKIFCLKYQGRFSHIKIAINVETESQIKK